MSKNWLPYPNNRKISYCEGYSIIVPDDYEKSKNNMPLFCEVCEIRFGHKSDEETFKKFKCCSACADSWAYSNKEKWENGWRPSFEAIKIAVNKRSFINANIVFE